jgi:hypothetical protein
METKITQEKSEAEQLLGYSKYLVFRGNPNYRIY